MMSADTEQVWCVLCGQTRVIKRPPRGAPSVFEALSWCNDHCGSKRVARKIGAIEDSDARNRAIDDQAKEREKEKKS
jgi:hypothetical protein